MSFRLYPLPQSKLENLRSLFEQAQKEMNLAERGDVQAGLERIDAGYISRSMAVYVDDVEKPSHCIVLATWPGIVTKGLLVAVILIYSLPEARGNTEAINVMMSTIENFAKLNGAECILGSSWKYLGARPIDSLWTSHGYVEQETTYVKLL